MNGKAWGRRAVLAALLALGPGAAAMAAEPPRSGSPAQPPPTQEAVASTAATASGLKGYTVVTGEGVTGYAGWFTHGEAACPSGTVPLAGGVLFESFDLSLNILDSYPSGGDWVVNVRNGLAGVTFDVYALCARQPRSYQIVTSAWYAFSGYAQTNGFVACPSGTKAFGGGAQTVSSSAITYLGQSSPSLTGGAWGVSVANESWSDTFEVYAVCAKPTSRYTVVTGPSVVVPAGTSRLANVYCPAGTVPLGGGIGFGWSEPDFGVHSTTPLLTGWSTSVNNLSDLDLEMQGSVACDRKSST
jgi:hypothetical protein